VTGASRDRAAGAGRAFCAGYDLDWGTRIETEAQALAQGVWDPVRDLRVMGANVKPTCRCGRAEAVIAGIHGYCVGGGTDLVLCADQIIAADDVRFGYPPSRVWAPRRRRCGCIVSASNAPSASCSPATRSTARPRPRSDWSDSRSPPIASMRQSMRWRNGWRSSRSPARHAQAAGQPDLREHGVANHAAHRDHVRRHRAAHGRGDRLAAISPCAKVSAKRCASATRRSGTTGRRRSKDQG